MKKRCSSCNKKKKANKFTKAKNTSKRLHCYCRKCVAKKKKEYHRTKKGLISKIYYAQRSSSKRRGHVPPNYTKGELEEYLLNNPTFNKLYKAWKLSGYNKRLNPSLDRIDDNEPYTFSNIQITTWEYNDKKAHEDFKTGKLYNKQKPVDQFSLDGKYIASYISVAEAARQTGSCRTNIGKCCRGKGLTCNNYTWRYKNV